MKLSPNRAQVPFIKLNNFTIEDSQLCIEYLSRVLQKDLNAHLNEDQKAIARAALKLTEESLRWLGTNLYRIN
jgi:hypothetical protein